MTSEQKGERDGESGKLNRQLLDDDDICEASGLALLALREFRGCGPTMSLSGLREVLDRELPGVSLSELIIKERELGY